MVFKLFAILQMYEFSSKSQREIENKPYNWVVCDTANVRVFKQITTFPVFSLLPRQLFAILQMYEFSSKSQPSPSRVFSSMRCLRYCKCTSFQANHNQTRVRAGLVSVVCDTANVRVFKQITTKDLRNELFGMLFAILQMYEFSSKSQRHFGVCSRCLVVCDTANVRVFKQITTISSICTIGR